MLSTLHNGLELNLDVILLAVLEITFTTEFK